MTTEQQIATLRGFRAWLGLEQKEAAAAAGLGEATLRRAERGDISDRTWSTLIDFYASRGLQLRDGDPIIVLVTA